MDPITAGVIISVLSHGAKRAASTGWRRLKNAGRYDHQWLTLGEGDYRAHLGANDVRDVEEFLDSAAVRPLLSLTAIVYLYAVGDEKVEAVKTLEGEFKNQAKKWTSDRNQKWFNATGEIWHSVTKVFDSDLIRLTDVDSLKAAIEEYSEFLQTSLSRTQGGPRQSSRKYLERLTALAADMKRLGRVTEVTDTLSLAIRESAQRPIINHANTDHYSEFDKLYVERTIYRSPGGEPSESSDVTEADTGFRMVLTGHPGAGKSTFVRHLQYQFAIDSVAPVPTVILKCREYFARAWNRGISEYLTEIVASQYNLSTTRADIDDLLTMGRLVCIFDGLDEIAQVPSRNEMVQRIQSFAGQNPATSILVASRSIGYHRAPMSDKMFTQYELKEFTQRQVAEYATKWFAIADRQDLEEPFLHECRTVADLTPNPLMLSLLCILYRNRGTIPRNRRQIYEKCADLLFYTWDRHRSISQPEDLPSYGDKIMQEIARWFYTSQSAQDGVEEQVIAKIISTHLRDIGGVEHDEARRRAEDFLEFCANRAWLLAAAGTSRIGARLFGFTHRTFLEFFAAEALSRMAESPEKVADIVEESYSRDSTSVMPELLVQAYDDRTYRGAERVTDALLGRDADAELILRLMDGVSLPARIREQAFKQVVHRWRNNSSLDLATFRALFSLNPDARSQFIETFLQPDADELAVVLKCALHGWAVFEVMGTARMFDDTWRETLVEALPHYLLGERSNVVDDWLLSSGYIKYTAKARSDLLLISSRIGGYLPGAGWRACEAAILGQSTSSLERRDILVKKTARLFSNGGLLPSYATGRFIEVIGGRLARVAVPEDGLDESIAQDVKNIVLGVLCLMHECNEYETSVYSLAQKMIGPEIDELLAWYDSTVREDEEPDVAQRENVQQLLRSAPRWCHRWLDGALDLRVVDTAEVELY